MDFFQKAGISSAVAKPAETVTAIAANRQDLKLWAKLSPVRATQTGFDSPRDARSKNFAGRRFLDRRRCEIAERRLRRDQENWPRRPRIALNAPRRPSAPSAERGNASRIWRV